MKINILLSIFTLAYFVSCYVQIPENARYSDNAGAVASITQEGLDYLKVLYLPSLYE